MRPVAIFALLALLAAGPVLAREAPESSEQHAIGLIQAGKALEAVRLLEKAAASSPRNVSLWNLLGIARTEAHQYTEAREAFERALALAPSSMELNENFGLLFFREQDYGSARKYLSRAAALGSDKSGVLFSLAAAELRTGESEKALAELVRLEPALQGNADYWEERGRAALVHDPASATENFAKALALGETAPLLNEAASASEKQGQDEKALSFLVRARALAPNDVPTLAHFGAVCIRRDLGPDARDALQRAYSLDPSNDGVLYLLGRANISLQNWQEAYNLFATFAKRAPTYAPAYYAMGWLDVRLNRPDDARKELKRALSLNSGLTGANLELAQLDLEDGDLETAEKLLRDVLGAEPRNAKANAALGDIMIRRQKLDAAEKLLEAAVEQDPTLASAHYRLAMLLFRTHRNERGEKERSIAAKLTEEAKEASKTQLRLVLPNPDTVQ